MYLHVCVCIVIYFMAITSGVHFYATDLLLQEPAYEERAWEAVPRGQYEVRPLLIDCHLVLPVAASSPLP